jgi:multiple sugar transport system permease protein
VTRLHRDVMNYELRPATTLKTSLKTLLLGGSLTLAVVWALFPIVWVVLTSLKKPLDVAIIPPRFFFHPSLDSYRVLFGEGDLAGSVPFRVYLFNSIAIASLSTLLTLVLSAPAAYSLARVMSPRERTLNNLVLLSFRFVPPIVLVVPLFVIFRHLGLVDTLTSLILPYAALNIPLAVWVLQAFFLDLPPEIEDAARVDGCNRVQAFIRVILPLVAPGLSTAAVFAFILAWSDFDFALPLTTSQAVTLPILASRVQVEEGILWGQMGAVTTVLVIPVVLFSVVAHRYLVAGLRTGATN